MSGEEMNHRVGVLLGAPRSGLTDVSLRNDARIPFEPGGRLPFKDRSVHHISLGDAAAQLPLRDQVQLLKECRRILRAGASITCSECDAAATHTALARWAELVGLAGFDHGWRKQAANADSGPLVSILIPSWNPLYFRECLDSAIAQTYRPIEIVICDDCPSDEIGKLAASRSGQADIRYFRNSARLGSRRNYEKCVSLANGEYVKFLNDDDILAPECVATMASAFQTIPDLALATSHRRRIDSASRIIDDIPATQPAVDRDLVINGISLANALIMSGLNFIGEPSTTLFRRRDFDMQPHLVADSPFHFNGVEVPGAIDFAMWSRLLVQGNAAFFCERLSSFRIHDQQTQARPEVVAKSIDGIRGLQKQWIALGLFRRFPPHLLLCQDYSPGSAETDNWRFEPVRSFRPQPMPPEEAVRIWRATLRHPFESA